MDKKKKIPKYQIIENSIINDIKTGKYIEDEVLPTENELAKYYEVARITVRQALGNLENKGFIRKVRGSGSYVNKLKTIQRTHLLQSFTSEITELGKSVRSEIRTFSIVSAGKTVSKILNINPSDQIFYVERVRFANNDPVLFEKSFFHTEKHPNLSMSVLLSSKYDYAEKNDMDVIMADQNISAIFPPEHIAKELQITMTSPMIKILNTSYTKHGNVFDYTELYLHPDLYQLNIQKRKL